MIEVIVNLLLYQLSYPLLEGVMESNHHHCNQIAKIDIAVILP